MTARRLQGSVPTRSRAVMAGGQVHTVATAPTKEGGVYEQTREALAIIDRNLRDAGTDKARVLTVMVYLADMTAKSEMNRAWEEWVDRENPPMRACIGSSLEGRDLVELIVLAALPHEP